MTSELEARGGRLLERLTREQERGPIKTAVVGDTAAVGGWSKIGQCVESLLTAVYDDLVRAAGEDAYRLKRDMKVDRRPTSGTWIEAILGFVRARKIGHDTMSTLAAVVVRDLAADRASALRSLLVVRNSLVHVGEKAPTLAEAHRALVGAIALMRRAGL
jgi:hypothetical protein